MSSGMGLVPITWEELRAFRLENDLDLTVWERQVLKKMSEAYCSEYSLAVDPQRVPPFGAVKEDEIDEKVELAKAMSWRQTIRSMGKNK